jgi:hypothetical protein
MARDIYKDSDDPAGYCIQRYRTLLQEWTLFGVEAQTIADHILPRKNSIVMNRPPGDIRTQHLFDSTAAKAAYDLASSIHGTLTSAYIKWFSLETDDPALNEEQAIAEWLQDCTGRMNSEFNKSNFAQEAHEAYIDLVCFGTACLFEDEADSESGGWGGLQFRTVPYGRYVIAEGPDGKANAVFRSFIMSAQAITLKQGWTVSDEIREARPDRKYQIIHGFILRSSGAKRAGSRSTPSFRIERCSAREFREFPYQVPRWLKFLMSLWTRAQSHCFARRAVAQQNCGA